MKFLNKKTGNIVDVNESSLELLMFIAKCDEYVAANDDGEHWITLHGGEGEGEHILISGSGKVMAGAGGNMNGKTLNNVKSKSKNVEKHGSPAPQMPPKPTEASKPEPAAEPAPEPPKQEQPKSEPTPQESATNNHESNVKAYEGLQDKVKKAKTPDEILSVMNEAKDLYTYFSQNWRTGDHDQQMANREKYLTSAATYNKLVKKYKAAKKKQGDAPAFQSEKDKEIQSKFSKSTISEISTHFQNKYGLGFENGSNHERDAKKLWSQYLETRKTGDEKKASELYEQYNEARKLARASAGGSVRGHTSYDVDDGSAGAKAVRKNLGYVDAALSSLDTGGFDLKAAMARANVKFASGSTGKALGHAWQDRSTGVGYFALSVSQPINGSADQMKMAQRRKERGDPLFTVSSGTDDVGRATIVHELAHALGMNKDMDSPGKLQNILTGLFPDIKQRREWIRNNLSEYATSNYKETDAELAALVTAPYYKRGTLPKEVEDHVDWLFMKRKE